MTTLDNFFSLTPEKILEAAEKSLDLVGSERRPTGVIHALNSIENRVYEMALEDGSAIVGKFYRPERWSFDQILEEHSALFELEKNEIPVVSPLVLCGASQKTETLAFKKNSTLGIIDKNIHFCFYPKIRGRSKDELGDSDLEVLGRFMARMHKALLQLTHRSKTKRLILNFENYFTKPLVFLEEHSFLPEPFLTRLKALVLQIQNQISPLISTKPLQLIHGDCHWGNLLWHQGQPLFLDFDDMILGPVVQDAWMLVGGRENQDSRKREIFIDSYNQFSEFPEDQWPIKEGLRAMRIVHYSYWIAKRWDDPSFPKMFPHFGTPQWWNEEIIALNEITEILSS
jgi:Ser/Thr protein kinase RdoA (MazF antagonist)